MKKRLVIGIFLLVALFILSSVLVNAHGFCATQSGFNEFSSEADANSRCPAKYPSWPDWWPHNCEGGTGWECYTSCGANHHSGCANLLVSGCTGGKRQCYDECSSVGVAADDSLCSGFCVLGSTTTSQTDLTKCNDKTPGQAIDSGASYTEGGGSGYGCSSSCQYVACANDGWYATTETQWVSSGACTEKEQKKYEKRNYKLTTTCEVTVEATEWRDTGNTRNKANGASCIISGQAGTCSSGTCTPAVGCDSYKTNTVCGQSAYDTCTSSCIDSNNDGSTDTVVYNCYASQKSSCTGTIQCFQTTCGQRSLPNCKLTCEGGTKARYDCGEGICTGSIYCAADDSKCTTPPTCGDGFCDSAQGETSSGCPSDCGYSNCGGANGCSSRGATRCSNDMQQTCDDYGKKCLEWGGDAYCNNGCDTATKKCSTKTPNSCLSGCQPYCLSYGPIRLFNGQCTYFGGDNPRYACAYQTQTCNDFNECTKNQCSPGNCSYSNEPNNKACYFTYPKKVSENNILPQTIPGTKIIDENSYVKAGSGKVAFSWKNGTGPVQDIYVTIIESNGIATDVLVESNAASEIIPSGATLTYYGYTPSGTNVYGPSISYSAKDDSFLVVWATVTGYSISQQIGIEQKCIREDPDGGCFEYGPVAVTKTGYYYKYSVYTKSVKNNVVGNKQLVASDTKQWLSGTAPNLFYSPVAVYSSADNRFMAVWINYGQDEILCNSGWPTYSQYSCSNYFDYAELQGAVTDANGAKLNIIYFGKYKPSYSVGGTLKGVQYFTLKNSPLIVASDDGKFLVLWTLNRYNYDSKNGLYISQYNTIGYLADSAGSMLNSNYYNKYYSNIAYDQALSYYSRSRAAGYSFDSSYLPRHALGYSPADKEFIVGAVIYTGFRSTTDNPFYEAFYHIAVSSLGNGTEKVAIPYKSYRSTSDGKQYGTTEFIGPDSLKLFRTNDAKLVVFWKQYYTNYQFFIQAYPAHRFLLLGKPPVISNGQPGGAITASSTTLSVQTDKPAICRYSISSGKEFNSMEQLFQTTNGISHSEPLSDLVTRGYNYHVRCVDSEGNENTVDYLITFIVSSPNPPVISNGFPTGTITESNIIMSVQTDKPATCKYDTKKGIAYDSMSSKFTTTGSVSHLQQFNVGEGVKTYYAKCMDIHNGNKTANDYVINFTVSPAWYIFTTNTTYKGDFREMVCSGDGDGESCEYSNGLEGADSKCQSRARFTGLGGTWKAWLSDGTTSAASRLNKGTRPYKLLNGVTVANNWTDLADGQLLVNDLGVDEFGKRASGNVWTNTKGNGSTYGVSGSSCQNWQTASPGGNQCVQWEDDGDGGTYCVRREVVPNTGAYSNTGYGLSAFSAASCDSAFRLYCLSQQGLIGGILSPPPVISNGQPKGTITASSPILSVNTNVQAACKYSTAPNIPYDSMTANLVPQGGTIHTLQLSGLTGSNTYYVKCLGYIQTNECISYGYDNNDDYVCQEYKKILSKSTNDYTITFKVNTAAFERKLTTLSVNYWQGSSAMEYSPQQKKIGVLWTDTQTGRDYSPSYYYSITRNKFTLHSLDTGERGEYDAPGAGFLIMADNYTRILYSGSATLYTDYKTGMTCGNGKCGVACPAGSTFDESCDGLAANTCSPTGSFCTSDGCSANKTDSDGDGFDDRCDSFPNDPCSVASELDNCNNKKGTGCPACVIGNVTDISGKAIGGAVVQIIGTRYSAVTNANGSYRIAPSNPGVFDFGASKTRTSSLAALTGSVVEEPVYSPSTLPNQEVYSSRITVVNITLGFGSSLCEQDCTFTSDDICHSSCYGTNGCLFYNAQTSSLCDNQHISFRFKYNSTYEVQCCNGAPYIPTRIKATTEINSSNVVRVVREAFYEGKLIKIVIDVFD